MKVNRKLSSRMFKKTIEILTKHDIPYWLDKGPLLGIIRDGDLLLCDHDADLGIPGEYAEKGF